MQKLLWTASCLLLLTLAINWASCSKSNSDSNSANVTLLTKSVWKFDTAGIDMNNDGNIDQEDPSLEACFKDNTYLFNKDSTVVMDEGATKCNSADPQTATYSWSLTNSNPPVLKSDVNPILAQGLKVRTLTDTKLTVYKDTSFQGIKFWYVLSLKH
ncbi:hypothetical protein Q4E93_24860 [Flavitalea sp. BT771]|uniref:hypothetical protein n=1 Tax=Flavitalea sp. BT771 TaxID=3063329 RepID=UPI0026E1A108|nr:hypothetical protein [Flavitalea sp. BT771]MDO6433861.1 hypothetical protein [Flavitalea sp. BT771]MDV6222234.1 hypothetical protein [Flavitalea sp. BT771]